MTRTSITPNHSSLLAGCDRTFWLTTIGFGLYLGWSMVGASASLLPDANFAAITATAIHGPIERLLWIGALVVAALASLRIKTSRFQRTLAFIAGIGTVVGTAAVYGVSSLGGESAPMLAAQIPLSASSLFIGLWGGRLCLLSYPYPPPITTVICILTEQTTQQTSVCCQRFSVMGYKKLLFTVKGPVMPQYKIADIRKSVGMTQAQLADRLGISQQTVQYYESGRSDIKSSVLVNMAKALGVTVTQLLGLENEFEVVPASNTAGPCVNEHHSPPQDDKFDTELSGVASSLNRAGRDVLMAVARSLAANPEFSA